MSETLSQKLRAPADENLTLAGFDPGLTLVDEDDAEDDLAELRERLFDLHELMMANEEHAVLLVLQGLDASGKNGTIKHVVDAMNP
ncbi:MAG: polyphosphate kinase 2 family protein, partial [Ilumatobacter sp.]|nr:polyphosphate kinase 2 family protein [Ilumatobacter sp.]